MSDVTGSMDNAPPKIFDSRDFALLVMVDHAGIADLRFNGLSKPQAVEWLRRLADVLEARIAKDDGVQP